MGISMEINGDLLGNYDLMWFVELWMVAKARNHQKDGWFAGDIMGLSWDKQWVTSQVVQDLATIHPSWFINSERLFIWWNGELIAIQSSTNQNSYKYLAGYINQEKMMWGIIKSWVNHPAKNSDKTR